MTYLDAAGWIQRGETGDSVITLGGGHGFSATLRALRHITRSLVAVVTVTDDGGSSGRMRQEMEILPPGDLRMALASLREESEWGLTWRDVLQTRLETTRPLNGHALDNLLTSGLWRLLDDPVEGLDWVARLLGATGRVLPMTIDPIGIEADTGDDGRKYTVSGQSKVTVVPETVGDIRIHPEELKVPSEITRAIPEAEQVVLGPGSWYTSVVPHLLVPDLHCALVTTSVHWALILNLSRQRGETDTMMTADHVRVIRKYAPDFRLDAVIAGPTATDDIDELIVAAEELGTRMFLRQVHTGDRHSHHDPLRLAAVLRNALDGFLGEVGRLENWLL